MRTWSLHKRKYHFVCISVAGERERERENERKKLGCINEPPNHSRLIWLTLVDIWIWKFHFYYLPFLSIEWKWNSNKSHPYSYRWTLMMDSMCVHAHNDLVPRSKKKKRNIHWCAKQMVAVHLFVSQPNRWSRVTNEEDTHIVVAEK